MQKSMLCNTFFVSGSYLLNRMECIHETSQMAISYQDNVLRMKKTTTANFIFELTPIVTTRSNDLVRLGIEDLDLILKERRLRWYGHVERSSCAIKTAFDIQVDGKRGPGRPKMTWKQLTERDCREWKLSAINPHDRRTWRSGLRSAMRAASQLSGRGPTDVDVAPVPAR